jgi:dienelactone hydrolase
VLARVRTNAQVRAPVARGRHPVVLFSPGYSTPRALYASLLEDLASRGYVVVAIDHTHETPVLEFPGGRIERGVLEPNLDGVRRALPIRVADAGFVLDRLGELERGAAPSRFAGRLDLAHVALVGHSLGGATAAEVLAVDPRVDAGVDLDGSFLRQAEQTGVAKPFLLVLGRRGTSGDPSIAPFLRRLDGSHLALVFRGAEHFAFSDALPLSPGLFAAAPVLRRLLPVGTLDPRRGSREQRAVIAAFLDEQLRGLPQRLLDGPSPALPDVAFAG